MQFNNFEDIVAWQRSRDLAVLLYEFLRPLKDYSFKDQICRAVISMSNNIAEGYERNSKADFKRFLCFAKGSAGEVRSMLYIAVKLHYISEEQFKQLYGCSINISKMLASLIKSLGV